MINPYDWPSSCLLVTVKNRVQTDVWLLNHVSQEQFMEAHMERWHGSLRDSRILQMDVVEITADVYDMLEPMYDLKLEEG